MIHPCSGRIAVDVSVDFCPIPHIDILEICKMALVKRPHFTQQPGAVYDSAAATGKHTARSVKIRQRFSFSARHRPSECRVIVAGIIDALSVVIINHHCPRGKDAVRFFDRSQQLLHEFRQNLRVVVEQDHIRRIRAPDALVHRSAEARILL